MPDRIFFPLMVALGFGFVFLALTPYAERPPTGPVSGGGRNAQDITVAGDELQRFLPGEGGGLTFIETPEGKILRLTRLANQTASDPRAGIHLVLAEDVEAALADSAVEVVIEARAAGDFAASKFEADYLARPGLESGWKTFDLTPTFTPYSFTYRTPGKGETESYDYIGVRPVAPDKRRTMEIKSVRIRRVEG